ncbi:MAG: baseplate J/gp47 family protein [Hyphomicrobiaceae bacterium]|nr:baseplate protein [Hyphomicrobiaceae bacterium]
MSNLTLRTFTSLVQGQAAAMQGRAKLTLNRTLDFSAGSLIRSLAEANSSIALWLQAEIVKVLLRTRARTSEGEELDTFVEDFGLSRLQSVLASGSVTFSRLTPSAQAIIPIGAEVETVDGTARFVVAADASNPAYNSVLSGYVVPAGVAAYTVPVVATVSGSKSNVAAGTITSLRTVIFHIDTVTNVGATINGGTQESDAALRTRFVEYIQSLARATVGAILFAVRSVRAGITATMIEFENPEGIASDICTVTVDDGTGYPALDLIVAARAAVERYRPAGVRFVAVSPRVVTTTVSMRVTIADGFDANDLVGKVGTAVKAHVDSRALGLGLSLTRLSAVAYGVSQGVVNVSDVRINGGTADVVGHPRQKVISTVVTVV